MSSDESVEAPFLSLTEEHGELTRSRIRAAAMKVVARRGFNATVEEIADESGVSLRTVFRRYKTHRALIASTLDDMFEAGTRPIEGLPEPTDDLDGWLEGLAVEAHRRNVEIHGEAIWDLRGPTNRLPKELAQIVEARLRYRRKAFEHFAITAWHAAGGEGPAPDSLTSAFTVQLSPFTAEVLMVDRDMALDQVGALTAEVLRVLLRWAIEEQQSQRSPAH